MFTGIIEQLGTVEELRPADQGAVLVVRTSIPLASVAIGDSIAVNGACLTVTAKSRASISMDVSAETLRRTVLGRLARGEQVNLETAMTLNKPINGHLVSGHVEGVGRIVSIRPEGESRLFTFEAPASEMRYIVEKGSVAVDGVSLTAFGLRGRRFSCELIPHTLKMTTLGRKGLGAPVNIETDMMAKYVEKLLAGRGVVEAAAAGAPQARATRVAGRRS